MCFGCSKEPSHRDGSFEYPQNMFWLRNKKNIFSIMHLIWRPVINLNSADKGSVQSLTTLYVNSLAHLECFLFSVITPDRSLSTTMSIGPYTQTFYL